MESLNFFLEHKQMNFASYHKNKKNTYTPI